MANHIIKYEYVDGVKLPQHKIITWCGSPSEPWMFQNAQHAVLSLDRGQLVEPCEKCLMAINSVISKHLQGGE